MLEYNLLRISPERLVAKLESDFALKTDPLRERLGLLEEYVNWTRHGMKKTTIRYRPNRVDCPISYRLPVFATTLMSKDDGPQVGWAHLTRMVVKEYGELDDKDALSDGFNTLADLKEALYCIYGKINCNELVSIYTFGIEEDIKP